MGEIQFPKSYSRRCTCDKVTITRKNAIVLRPITDLAMFYNCEICGTTLAIEREVLDEYIKKGECNESISSGYRDQKAC